MARAQLPLLVATVFVTVATVLVVPEVRDDLLLGAGSLIILISSITGVLLPWERWAPGTLIILALADIVGVALIHTALLAYLPAAGMLVIFPVL
ncbi:MULTISPECIES: hypothetical protein [unclassified Microbacterium]|uniref:hypothetical protein n=1 Tax=unclassified Microbacterium TaxID=2609290 RepID=UPI000C2BB6A1|nr:MULTISPECIES: hypothetical protein [unclassified Microbacterium]